MGKSQPQPAVCRHYFVKGSDGRWHCTMCPESR